MAKRFGRNQRRKMRDELSAKASQIDSLSTRLDRANRDYGEISVRLHRWAQDVLDLAGPDSAFNEMMRQVEVDARQFDYGRMDLAAPVQMPLRHADRRYPFYVMPEKVIEAMIYTAHLDSDITLRMREQVRICIQSKSGKYALAVSDDRNWTSRDVDVLSRMIAQEIAQFRASDAHVSGYVKEHFGDN